MASKLAFHCDACKREKGETNHWFLIFRTPRPVPEFVLIPWDDTRARDPDYSHICSHECAHTRLEEFLGSLQ